MWISTFVILLAVTFRTLAIPDDTFSRALEERMPELLPKYRVPGAVVSYITNGEVIWTKAFGRANLKTCAPMRPDMVFNHGSNGKVLTTWGIMRLVEQGKVELDAPANRYLKRWQLRSSQFDPEAVTVRRLPAHTAGLTVHGFLVFAHFGGNPGWNAHFLIDATRREGFVVANNSSQGLPFNIAVQKLWFRTSLGAEVGTDPPSLYMNPTVSPAGDANFLYEFVVVGI